MPVVKMILTLKLSMVIVMTMAWRKIEAMVATRLNMMTAMTLSNADHHHKAD